jgi:P4 family phage/plasmid primase-like protien
MNTLEEQAVERFRAQYRDTVFTLGCYWRFRDGAWQPVPLDVVRAELGLIYANLGLQVSARQLARLLDQFSLRLARPVATWNLDPALLPCRNGLLQLDTRQLLPHPASVFQARTLAAAYDPDAAAPAWDAFLAGTLPASADFLQEFAGLALTFDPRYEIAIWLYGPPGSGKSTFLVGLQAMLGDRAGQLDLLTLARRRLAPAQLFGRSLLLSAEQPLAALEHDNLLNALISGEPLLGPPPAGAPGREPELLALRAKWIWAMVALPRLNRSTSGLYRRVRIVPFPPRAEADRDPSLKSRLALEASGILNWALAGLARLTRRGRFAPPPSVALAGDQFHEANDLAAQFVAEACLVEPSARESASLLYQHYVNWCRRSAARPESIVAVAACWEQLGFQRTRTHGRSFWTGVRLRSSPVPSNASPMESSDDPDSVAPLAPLAPAAPAAPAAPPP